MKYIFSWAGVVILLFSLTAIGEYFSVPVRKLYSVLFLSGLGIVPYILKFFGIKFRRAVFIVLVVMLAWIFIFNLIITAAVYSLKQNYFDVILGGTEEKNFYGSCFLIILLYMLVGVWWRYRQIRTAETAS